VARLMSSPRLRIGWGHRVARWNPPPEEQDLLARFGMTYSHYQTAVPLWRPRYPGYKPLVN